MRRIFRHVTFFARPKVDLQLVYPCNGCKDRVVILLAVPLRNRQKMNTLPIAQGIRETHSGHVALSPLRSTCKCTGTRACLVEGVFGF
jgi:hypothetical protein